MQIINNILSLFIRHRQPVFGPNIFAHRSWLSRQVEEAQYKKSFRLD
jgi:hypothetical protein